MDDSGFISPEAIRSADVFESKKEKKIDENENSSFLTPVRTQKSCLPTRRSRAKRKSDLKNEPAHLLTKSPKKIEGVLAAMCPKSLKSKIDKKEPLGELAYKVGRNPEIVKVILSSMSVKEQLKCSWVSKTWRKEVQLSCSPVLSFKKELEKNYDLNQIDKENAPNFSHKKVTLETSGSILSPAVKTPKKKVEEVLTPVENNLPRKAPSTPKKIPDTTLSPVSQMLLNKPSANKGKDLTEIEVRRHLQKGDFISKCPFCSHPCRRTPREKKNRGICYNSDCGREFCGSCRRQHAAGDICSVSKKSVRKLFSSPDVKIKTTIRRL